MTTRMTRMGVSVPSVPNLLAPDVFPEKYMNTSLKSINLRNISREVETEMKTVIFGTLELNCHQ